MNNTYQSHARFKSEFCRLRAEGKNVKEADPVFTVGDKFVVRAPGSPCYLFQR